MTESDRQEFIDAFYQAHGPCCAGCDWWRHLNSGAGECTRSPPMPSRDRFAMLGIEGSTLDAGAGHAVTPRSHLCGEFKDDFDWSSLSPWYLRRIGYSPSRAAREAATTVS